MQRPRATMVSLFMLSMAVLLMQVCLTRVFSVISWHHFAYLIISLALLGFGAAGSYLTVSKRFAGEAIDSARLGRFAWMLAVSIVAALLLVSRIRFWPVDIVLRGDYSNVLSLLIIYAVVGVPFFFAGICIGRLVALAGDRVNQFYFADLTGAGAGAILALPVINYIGAVGGIFISAALAAAVACVLGAGGVHWRRWAYGLTLAGAIGLVVMSSLTDLVPLHYPPSKGLFRGEHKVEFSRWHVVGKIDVMPPKASYWSFGGALSRRYKDVPPKVQGIYQDGAAPTGIMLMDGRPEDARILGEYLQGVAYTVRPSDSSLIIGVGGGIDGLIAMHHGVRRVVGVDLNPVTVDVAGRRYRGRCPALWSDGRFSMHVAEGRHYLTRTDERFDVIQLSGVDTFTALSSGAYALCESFLYTSQAMGDYWDHLTPDGILSFSRWLFTPPRETLRLVTTQLEMLEDAGVSDPWRHFVVLAGPAYEGRSPWAETLLKRSDFTPDEVDRLIAWAGERQFEVLYDPFHKRANKFDGFIRAGRAARAGLIDEYRFNVRPTTDDDPFFFQFYRWGSVFALAGGKSGLAGSKGGYGITRMPLGFIILAASLLQMLVLSLIFIVAPLWMRGRLRTQGRGRAGVLVYFAALGFGFMFVEIALLQRLSVFVGGPVYSMAITLAAILVFSGLGSYVARAFRRRPYPWLTGVIAALAVGIVGEIYFLNHVLDGLMGLSLPLRWLAAAGAIFPVAFLLGMPFPTGLRIVRQVDESIRPWTWGVNACATVLGSMLCVLLSIHAGFTTALATAVGIYILGWLGITWTVRQNRQPA